MPRKTFSLFFSLSLSLSLVCMLSRFFCLAICLYLSVSYLLKRKGKQSDESVQWFVISLWIFFICTSKWSLLLALWGQYGHWIRLPIPHSALKCLVRVAFELYTRLQFGHMWQPISRLFSFGFDGCQGSSVSWLPSAVLFPNIIWPLAPTIRYSPKNVNSKLKMRLIEKGVLIK